MFNWIKENKVSSAIAFLLIGLVVGLGIAVNYPKKTQSFE